MQLAEDDVIAGFYRAAQGTITWNDALHNVSTFLNCWVSQVLGVDLRHKRILYTYEGGWSSAEPVVEYLRHYHAEDPHIRAVFTTPIGEWYHSSDFFDDASISGHPYYQDFLIPYNNKFISGTRVFEDESTVIVFAVIRSTSTREFNPEERRQLDRLGFHMAQAIVLWRQQRQVVQGAAVGRELLDRIVTPILLIDAERRVSVANHAALKMLGRLTSFNTQMNVFRLPDVDADRQLTIAMRRLELAGQPTLLSEARLDRVFLNVSFESFEGSICLIAVRPDETLRAFAQEPVAMVLFHDLSSRVELDPFVLSTAFALTPAEARIAVSLTAGKVPKQIATAQDVSLATIRTQMKSLYRKMRVRGSGELISLLSSAPFVSVNPILPGHDVRSLPN